MSTTIWWVLWDLVVNHQAWGLGVPNTVPFYVGLSLRSGISHNMVAGFQKQAPWEGAGGHSLRSHASSLLPTLLVEMFTKAHSRLREKRHRLFLLLVGVYRIPEEHVGGKYHLSYFWKTKSTIPLKLSSPIRPWNISGCLWVRFLPLRLLVQQIKHWLLSQKD